MACSCLHGSNNRLPLQAQVHALRLIILAHDMATPAAASTTTVCLQAYTELPTTPALCVATTATVSDDCTTRRCVVAITYVLPTTTGTCRAAHYTGAWHGYFSRSAATDAACGCCFHAGASSLPAHELNGAVCSVCTLQNLHIPSAFNPSNILTV